MKRFLCVGLLMLSTVAYGSGVKPLALQPVGGGIAPSGEPWKAYRVRCDNGKEILISNVRGQNLWCINDPSPLPRNCRKDKVSAAKLACNPNRWKYSNFPASED